MRCSASSGGKYRLRRGLRMARVLVLIQVAAACAAAKPAHAPN